MPRSEARRPDLRGWLAVAWAAWFGASYAAMILRSRAPGLWEACRQVFRR